MSSTESTKHKLTNIFTSSMMYIEVNLGPFFVWLIVEINMSLLR